MYSYHVPFPSPRPVLEAIYEQDFLPCSYGFRPQRSPQQALAALEQALVRQKVSAVLDIDIRRCFDSMDHEHLLRFVQHRVKDRSILRLLRCWVRAGVWEAGVVTPSETGTPQGGVISPLLANSYLHYVVDLWAERRMRKTLRGEMVLVRYADDVVVGFQYRDDAETFQRALATRLAQFGLALNAAKTRLLEFGRFAAERAARRGRKPETFDFLGFTHICGRTRRGAFQVRRKTSRKRLGRVLTAIGRWFARCIAMCPSGTSGRSSVGSSGAIISTPASSATATPCKSYTSGWCGPGGNGSTGGASGRG